MATTAIVGVLTVFLETIITAIFKCSLWIGNEMLNSSVTIFGEVGRDTNFFEKILGLLPVSEKFNFGGAIYTAAYSIIILTFLFASAKNAANNMLPDTKKESLAGTAIRAAAAGALIAIVFGVKLSPNAMTGEGLASNADMNKISSWVSNGLMGQVGLFFSKMMLTVQSGVLNLGSLAENTKLAKSTLNIASSGGLSGYIGYLILYASLIGSVITAALSYIERIITLALTVTLGPIAAALYVNNSTKDIFTEWLKSVFVQFGAIFYSYIMWLFFQYEMLSLADEKGAGGERLFTLALAIVFLNLVKNSEKLFNAFGVRTMPNIDSVRSVAAGMMAARAITRGVYGKGALVGREGINHAKELGADFRHRGDLSGSGSSLMKETEGNIGMQMKDMYNGSDTTSGKTIGNVEKGKMQGMYGTSGRVAAQSNTAWDNITKAINNHDTNSAASPYVDNINADTINTALTGSPNGYLNGIRANTDSHIRPFIHTINDANGNEVRCLAFSSVRANGNTGKLVDNGIVSIPLTGDSTREVFTNEAIKVEGSNTKQLNSLRYDGTSYQMDKAGHRMYHLSNTDNVARTPRFTGKVPERSKNANHPQQ